MVEKNIKRRGLMLVLSSPSGVGKTTLASMILNVDKHIHSSISYTTRAKRNNEEDGIHYFFISESEFEKLIQQNFFLEYAKVFGHYYGTPRHTVEAMLNNGEDVLFDIDWQGHKILQSVCQDDVVGVFILPPSKSELKDRLQKRACASGETIALRLEKANSELAHWKDYDYTIINKDLDDSLKKLQSILRAERLKKNRRCGVIDFVNELLQQDF